MTIIKIMKNLDLQINAAQEVETIRYFLKDTFHQQGIDAAVLGLSGGIDSAVSLYLLKQALPPENIHVAHLYYFEHDRQVISRMLKDCHIPTPNITMLSIKPMVDTTAESLHINPHISQLRLGNIMARVRMITLFDLAKQKNALVVGTENRTEHLLGYFTRFGDAASDIEPIVHLYKTQVRELARYLDVPEEVRTAAPTAGLWDTQTDEKEFGFTYEEADEVLNAHFDQNIPLEKIAQEIPIAEEILAYAKKNEFKNKTPYTIR